MTKGDAILLLLLGAALVYIEFFGEPREQPIDLSDPAFRNPLLPDIVSTPEVLLLSFVAPPFGYWVAHVVGQRPRQQQATREVLTSFTTGLFEANILTLLATNVVKILVGRPRPHFATVCKVYEPAGTTHCTGDAALVREARKSFPSGHSSLAFSAGVFLLLSLARYLGLAESQKSRPVSVAPKLTTAVLVSLPVGVAGLVAVSRINDYHHHYSDVVAGALVGTFYAVLIFVAHGGFTALPSSTDMVAEETLQDTSTDLAEEQV